MSNSNRPEHSWLDLPIFNGDAVIGTAQDIHARQYELLKDELDKVKRMFESLAVNIPSHGGVQHVSRETYRKLKEHPNILWAYDRGQFDQIGTAFTLYIAEDDGAVMPFLDEVLKS